MNDAGDGDAGNNVQTRRTRVSNDKLRQFAKDHPAPQEWWDATDDPFEPVEDA